VYYYYSGARSGAEPGQAAVDPLAARRPKTQGIGNH